MAHGASNDHVIEIKDGGLAEVSTVRVLFSVSVFIRHKATRFVIEVVL